MKKRTYDLFDKKIFFTKLFKFLLFFLVIFGLPFIYNYTMSKNDVIVLAYHHFMTNDEKELYAKDNAYTISTENFEEQLKYLKDNGYKSITSSDIYCYIEGKCDLKGKNVLITMDDGNISSYYKALPLLEKYGYNSINFIIGIRTSEKSEKWGKFDMLYFVGKDIIEDIRKNHLSMEIGAHSFSLHSTIDGKSPLEVLSYEELLEDTKKIKEFLDTDVFCFPFGGYNEKLTKALKEAGFKMSFTFNPPGFVTRKSDFYAIERIEIEGDFNIKQFQKAISKEKTVFEFWKDVIKRIFEA